MNKIIYKNIQRTQKYNRDLRKKINLLHYDNVQLKRTFNLQQTLLNLLKLKNAFIKSLLDDRPVHQKIEIVKHIQYLQYYCIRPIYKKLN